VLLPENETNLGGHGKVVYAAGDAKTGSGSVTINLDDVYAGLKTEVVGKDAKGGAIERTSKVDIGVHGVRAFAVDYSKASGADALFAVVDRIDGGGAREWLFQLPPKSDDKVKIDGNTFTLTQGDASLRATFVTPAGVKLRIMHDTKKMSDVARTGVEAKLHDVPLNCVAASAKAGESFFVIMTLTRGAHPKVEASGSGLGAQVNVGGQSVRFADEKLTVGK
jgi:hypothetical protein